MHLHTSIDTIGVRIVCRSPPHRRPARPIAIKLIILSWKCVSIFYVLRLSRMAFCGSAGPVRLKRGRTVLRSAATCSHLSVRCAALAAMARRQSVNGLYDFYACIFHRRRVSARAPSNALDNEEGESAAARRTVVVTLVIAMCSGAILPPVESDCCYY